MQVPCAGDTNINPLEQRRAGVLLHPTSLPSGTLNEDAFRWLDFMQQAGFSVWQMLPLVIPDHTGSPYQSCSAFAADPALLPDERPLLDDEALAAYRSTESYWLEDFALFQVLKQKFHQRPWYEWPSNYRDRDTHTLNKFREDHESAILEVVREQLLLDHTWQRIRHEAKERGIALYGDIPIFVAHDSADVWANPHCFLLDENRLPTHVAGVPPDYFSETGQRWGNPHYDWEAMQQDGFGWWRKRLQRQFEWFDILRLDHFRGLEAVWMIPAECETAIDGFWQQTPGDALLETLREHYPDLPIVAEDLGVITEEVRALRCKHHLPGMSILQFAFDAFDDNPHKPANITPDTVVYTGTHDNDTTVGWFKKLQSNERDFVFQVLGTDPTEDIAGALIDAALHSSANLAMMPLQDLLRLDSDARMNIPGASAGNWQWRFDWGMISLELSSEIHRLIEVTGRKHDI